MRALFFLLILLVPAIAQENAASITGTYSSLVYNQEGGDLLGAEVTITRDRQGYKVRFQIAEGSPSDVVTVPAAVRGGHISFVIPKSEDGSGFYSGRVTKAGLRLFEGSQRIASLTELNPSKTFLLKRKCSYWVKCPASSPTSR